MQYALQLADKRLREANTGDWPAPSLGTAGFSVKVHCAIRHCAHLRCYHAAIDRKHGCAGRVFALNRYRCKQ